MDNYIRIAIVMEMLAANLITVNNCARRNYSKKATLAVLLGFTFILTFFTHNAWDSMGFDEGNAAFALIGIVYLIPLKFLYREKTSYITSILFSAWIYTLIIYCSSVYLARLTPLRPLIHNILLIQSALYAATYYVFTIWTKKGLMFILLNIAKSSRYIHQLVSLGWFFSIIIIHSNLIYKDNRTLSAGVVLTMISNSVLSYLLLFSMVKNQKQIKNLEYEVYTDHLTGLNNRSRLFKDIADLIDAGTAFRLYFIDLNRFKQINDKYGHRTGDQYLICFSSDLKAMLRETEQLYRMSGDEFVIISRACDHTELSKCLAGFPDTLNGLDIPFLGMSTGWADYPQEECSTDRLITLADRRMYQSKPGGSR